MVTRFDVGKAYPAVPVLEAARKRMAVVIGRQGRFIQLAWVNGLSTEKVNGMFFDREFLLVTRPDGEYTISAACPLDVSNAAEVMSMISSDLKAEAALEAADA